MLQITVPSSESFNERTGEFVYTKETVLQLEHSLLSLSKWEAKWQKPFLWTNEKTYEETIDYIRCMTLNKGVDPNVYYRLDEGHFKQIGEYIDNPMTATTFTEHAKGKRSSEIVTSELIYYWMVALQIPFECQKWHLNRLLTLVQICNIKNQPPKKMSKGAILRSNAELNKARRAKLHSRG